MSEEWKEEFFEWKDEIESKFNNLSQKHSELEKKPCMKIETIFTTEQMNWVNKVLSGERLTLSPKEYIAIVDLHEDLKQQIAEQKKSIEVLDEAIGGDQIDADNNRSKFGLIKEINDLKEEHNLDIYTLLHAINGWGKNHINLEEVLRKHFNYLRKNCIVGSSIDRHTKGLLKKLDNPKQAEKKPTKQTMEQHLKAWSNVISEEKKENENPYLDLGMITSKNGELSDYNPSQFIRDYAKTHTLFSLHGLVFPEEDSGGELSGATIGGLGSAAGKIPHDTLTDSKPSELIKECSNCGFAIDHRPATYFGYAIECINSGTGKDSDYWCTSWKPKEKTEPEKELYTLHLNGNEFDFKRTTHPFTEYNNMVHRGIGMKLMPYNTEKELIEEFSEKLEFLRDKVLEAPIISGSVQDLRDHTHNIKDLIIKTIKEYEGG